MNCLHSSFPLSISVSSLVVAEMVLHLSASLRSGSDPSHLVPQFVWTPAPGYRQVTHHVSRHHYPPENIQSFLLSSFFLHQAPTVQPTVYDLTDQNCVDTLNTGVNITMSQMEDNIKAKVRSVFIFVGLMFHLATCLQQKLTTVKSQTTGLAPRGP